MKALDMVHLCEKYRGSFVALTRDRKKVLVSGHTLKEVRQEVKRKGYKSLIFTRIPDENRSYLL